ncbi:MAG: TorF family putative porin [Erythrobacter sp.]
MVLPATAPVDAASASQLGAGGLTISANAALATQYRFRGANLSGDQVAFQGGVDVDHASGFYIGVWASQLSNRTTGYGGVELDIYGGYNWRLIEGLTADVGIIAYTFPDAPADGLNFFELYSSLTFTLGPASAKAGLAWDPGANGFAFAGFARDNLYIYSDLAVGIPATPLTLKAHLGYTDGTRQIATNSGTFDWSVGASYKVFGPITASLEYVDAAANVPVGPINPNAGNLVGRISVRF